MRNRTSYLKANFARVVSPGRSFIPEVDGLRFVAIAFVVLFHLRAFTLGHGPAPVQPAETFVSTLLKAGDYGVQLFFILSGFLLALPFAKWRLALGPRPSLRRYYLRRVTRIEPPYLVAMVLLFAAGVAAHLVSFGASKWPGMAQWPNLVASLFYQHNLVYGESSRITPVAWSLEIEVQFYLLAPVLAAAFSLRHTRARRIVFGACVVALPLLRSFLPPHFEDRYNSLPWHLEYFVCGFLLADIFLVDWKEAPPRSFAWDVVSLIGWPVLVALMAARASSVFLAPVALVCFLGTFRGTVSHWVLSRPAVTTIGGMCYSIYLLHYTVFMAAGALTRKLAAGSEFFSRLAIEALVTLPAVLLVSAGFFVLLERRCMDPEWAARLARRFTSKGALAAV